MKKLLPILLMSLIPAFSLAQFSTYSPYMVKERFVGEVEDMEPAEIKAYNAFVDAGVPDTVSLYLINAARAQENLINAPATIINYSFIPSDALGGEALVSMRLINTTTKTISEAQFTFDFFNDNREPVYDIKTGDKYLTLTFRNLTGRTSSAIYRDIARTARNTYHQMVSIEPGCLKKPFVNRKAKLIKCVKALITYTDGTSSQNVAVFTDDDLYNNGPLQPIAVLEKMLRKSSHKETDTALFLSL